MNNFSQLNLFYLMYKISYDQLVYWYELANYVEHKVEPLQEKQNAISKSETTVEDFRKGFTHTDKGWVLK
jgi:hypothetical protein